MFHLLRILVLLLGPHCPHHAQAAKAELTLEDIYKNDSYPTRYYRSVRWLEDSRHYTTLETNKERGCSEIIRYHAKSGERVVLVGADQLVPAEGSRSPGAEDYQWSDDNNKLLAVYQYPKGMEVSHPGRLLGA